MDLSFRGDLWYWRGPAPFHFVTVPRDEAEAIREVAPAVTYGWGMIPATVRVGASEWATALWPKDGGYIVPIKKWVQEAERLDIDDVVAVRLRIDA
ncbi:DUF1905 domain-containing protein [Agromyces sp. SYSU T00194]|uniref:DUF1905 domain-containing protein n=1 Tax=Agromyces chitinivorans TaxID=3158560 RepID=UPI003392C3A5